MREPQYGRPTSGLISTEYTHHNEREFQKTIKFAVAAALVGLAVAAPKLIQDYGPKIGPAIQSAYQFVFTQDPDHPGRW